ncbi:hypothetical protein BJV82DRAFT_582048 [Fennellomyces sp. T-0311]|nr:hypothetical protein BJV82DRAFT_582048 [Fennellomyces sp. T-0311]
MSYQLVNVLPHFSQQVRNITIDTSVKKARCKWMQMVMNGCFPKIESLNITARAMNNLGTHVRPMLIGFWQMKATLTSLELHLGSNKHAVGLADVLWLCPNITDLTYSTEHSLSTLAADNYSMLYNNNLLDNLQLISSSITASDIDILLQRSQQLRRLVMSQCNPTVLDAVNEYAPASLKVLGINSSVQVPQLVMAGNQENDMPGLQNIYVENSRKIPTEASKALPLLHKHKDTLEIIHTDLSALSNEELWMINDECPKLKLNRVAHLAYWSMRSSQQFMLQIISNTTTLTSLHVYGGYDLNGIVTTVLNLPRLSEFQLWWSDTQNSTALIRLFNTIRSTSLNYVGFHECTEVTNDVLAALTNVKTLQKIDLEGLENVTAYKIIELFATIGNQLAHLSLSSMSIITDEVITALASLNNLKSLYLHDMKNITDRGLQGFIEGRNQEFLSSLTVDKCPAITKECINHVKQ